MSQLSPAAKAVLDAAANTPVPEDAAFGVLRFELAAGFRAAAKQFSNSVGPGVQSSNPFAQGMAAGVAGTANALRSIAAELEAMA